MGKMFLFLKLVHFKFYMYLIVVTNRHSVVARRRAERNYTRCKYQHK